MRKVQKNILRVAVVLVCGALLFAVYYYIQRLSGADVSASSEISEVSEIESLPQSSEESLPESSEESLPESSEESLPESSEESLPESSQAPETPSSQAEPPAQSSAEVSSAQVPAVEQPSQPQKQETAGSYNVRTPSASGSVTYSGGGAVIDASNTSDGYVMVKFSGNTSKIRVQITKGSGTTYTYALNSSGYSIFPFSEGSGSYSVNVYENVSGNQYALATSASLSVNLNSSFAPFLRPNQYVYYYDGCSTVSKGARLASTASNDLQIVENVYNFVIKNISYDFNKANNVSFPYIPDVDSTISTGKGICFDYAAVMAAMLRTQNIPTKLVMGYAGNIYHAWISTYISDVGWVNGIIYFDGQSWKRMDPTFASSANQSSDIMSYIGNGSNYSSMYQY